MLTTCTDGCRAEAGRDDLSHDLLLVDGQLCNRWDYGRRGPPVHRGPRVDRVDSSSQKAEVPKVTSTGSLRPGLPDRSARHRTRGGGRESIGPREPGPRTMSLDAHEFSRPRCDGTESGPPPGVRTTGQNDHSVAAEPARRSGTARGGRGVTGDARCRWALTPLFP